MNLSFEIQIIIIIVLRAMKSERDLYIMKKVERCIPICSTHVFILFAILLYGNSMGKCELDRMHLAQGQV
jgi:hypothetical protein